jgi:putative ABC transport system ATP-binding protein
MNPRIPLLSLQNVNLTLPSLTSDIAILQQITLDVHDRETIAVVGPSGSGKTSLMMLMSGLEKPTSGTITTPQGSLNAMSENALAHYRMHTLGIVFQSFHLIPTMTAVENVMVPLSYQGLENAEDVAKSTLKAVGLAHRFDHYPAQLSGGEQQRVAIARAVATKPILIMADEPTGNLDHETGQQIMDLLFNLHETLGSTLILITHDHDLAKRCRRTVHLMDGRVISPLPSGEGQG